MSTFVWFLVWYYLLSGVVAGVLCWMAIPSMWSRVPWRWVLYVLIPFIGFWLFGVFWFRSFMEYFSTLYEGEGSAVHKDRSDAQDRG